MAIRIPTSNLPKYTEVVVIDRIAYTLAFNWNSREETWRMGIFTAGGDPIVRGLKILPGVNLTARFKDVRLPSTGSFVAFNIEDAISAPGRNDLVEKVQVWFMTTEEVNALPDGFIKVV